MTEQNIQKELDEISGNNEGMAARKSFFDRPDNKKTLEFVHEI